MTPCTMVRGLSRSIRLQRHFFEALAVLTCRWNYRNITFLYLLIPVTILELNTFDNWLVTFHQPDLLTFNNWLATLYQSDLLAFDNWLVTLYQPNLLTFDNWLVTFYQPNLLTFHNWLAHLPCQFLLTFARKHRFDKFSNWISIHIWLSSYTI